jgi:C-3',4' desaturase CrtD
VGGLTTAALAAADGLDVLVVEAHTRPGGCAGDFWRRGVLLPAGATLVSGFEPGGLHDRIYRRLGLTPRVRAVQPAMRVVLPDRALAVPTDWEAWETEWRQAFPGQDAAKARFWREVRALDALAYRFASQQPVLPPSALDLVRLLPALRPADVVHAAALWQTVGDRLRRCAVTDGAHERFLDAQLLISMQCVAADCVALNGGLALGLYRHGCYYPEGGPGAIAADLAAAVTAQGSAIRYQAPVSAVRRRAGGWAVTLAGAEQLIGCQVVLNLAAWAVPELLGEDCPAPLRARVQRLPEGWGAVVLHGVVDASPALPPAPAHVQVVADYARPLPEGNSCFVSLLPGEGRAAGRLALAVSTHTQPRRWRLPDRAAYEAQRDLYRERLLAAAERALPGIRAHLRHVECATPRTFARFTSRPHGLVGGLPQTREWANFRALSHRVDPRGLYLVGDTVFPGAGTIGVTLSGLNAYRDVRRAAATRALPAPRPRPSLVGRAP